MIFDCIVCARDFEAKPDSGRLTCSVECKTDYLDFLDKIKLVHPDYRYKLITQFFYKIDFKYAQINYEKSKKKER